MSRELPPVLAVGSKEALGAALAALDDGAVVAVPSDTVYGLAARADRPDAMRAIFSAKDRPDGLALPVLVGRERQVHEVATAWPEAAVELSARFWPGPLTVVVPTAPELGALLGGDGHTVGLRQPKHRFLQQLCKEAGPLAVTSANRHGRPACTTAAEVVGCFDQAQVALVVDGGTCDGTPSTVVDCTTSPPSCRRDGAVPWNWIEASLALGAARRRPRLFRRRRG